VNRRLIILTKKHDTITTYINIRSTQKNLHIFNTTTTHIKTTKNNNKQNKTQNKNHKTKHKTNKNHTKPKKPQQKQKQHKKHTPKKTIYKK